MTESPQHDRSECVFCRIIDGEIPASVVRRGDRVIAFRDLAPQAPTHVLVVPTTHYRDVTELAENDPTSLAELVAMADAISREEGHDGQYRLVFNTGEAVGQSVFHTHGHVLTGRSFTWPPG